MKRRARTASAALLAWLPLAGATVPEPAATPAPPACVLRLPPPAQRIGHGTLRWFGLRIYDATLWSGHDGFDAHDLGAQALALRLRYARAIDGADLARRSAELMHGDADAATLAAWQRRMRQVFPNVHPGDTLCGVFLPRSADGPTTLFLSGDKPLGRIAGADFARAFFGIWLGPRSHDAALRRQLLAGAAR